MRIVNETERRQVFRLLVICTHDEEFATLAGNLGDAERTVKEHQPEFFTLDSEIIAIMSPVAFGERTVNYEIYVGREVQCSQDDSNKSAFSNKFSSIQLVLQDDEGRIRDF